MPLPLEAEFFPIMEPLPKLNGIELSDKFTCLCMFRKKESKNTLPRGSKGFSAHSKATKSNKTLPVISESAGLPTLLYCQVDL